MKKLFIFSVVILSGCQTYSQLSPERQALQLSQFEKNCQSFGLKPGTVPFGQCIQQSIDAFDQPTAEGRRKAREEIGDDLLGAS